MPIRQMKKLPAKALGLHQENPRTHSKERIRQLARYIQQSHPAAPPVINEDGVVLDAPALLPASVQDREGRNDDVPAVLLEAARQAAARKRRYRKR